MINETMTVEERMQEVEEYCKRLIDEVGDGGGFMLTTGCECPIDVKPENLRAMVETGKSCRGKKGRASPQPVKEARKEETRQSEPTGEIAQAIAGLSFDEATKRADQAIAEGRDPLGILNE